MLNFSTVQPLKPVGGLAGYEKNKLHRKYLWYNYENMSQQQGCSCPWEIPVSTCNTAVWVCSTCQCLILVTKPKTAGPFSTALQVKLKPWQSLYLTPLHSWPTPQNPGGVKCSNPMYLFYKVVPQNVSGQLGDLGDKHYCCYHGNNKIIMVTKSMKSNLDSLCCFIQWIKYLLCWRMHGYVIPHAGYIM